MEVAFEPSFPTIRNKIALIEAIEFFSIGFVLWAFVALAKMPDTSLGRLILDFFVYQTIFLSSWGIYNIYIRIARAGGRFVDVGIWVLASLATGTYTFWAWTILDINRFILSRLFYRGEAPIEYAWSWRSKQVRKLWEQAQKVSND